MKSIYLHLWLFIFLFISGCKVVRISPEPVVGNLPERPDLEQSVIALPLSFDIKELQASLDQSFPYGQITAGNWRDGHSKRYSYWLYREKPLRLSATKKDLIIDVPLRLKVKAKFTLCLGWWSGGRCVGSSNSEHGDVNEEVVARVKISLDMLENYSIQANTGVYVLNESINMQFTLIGKLIKISVNVKPWLKSTLENFTRDAKKLVDSQLNQVLAKNDFKKTVAGYWMDIQRPQKFGSYWLDMNPEKVLLQRFDFSNSSLQVVIGLTGDLKIQTAEPPLDFRPLPNLTILPIINEGFSISLPANVQYEFLENEIKKEIVGRDYRNKFGWVKIKDVEIEGAKVGEVGVLLVKAAVKGKALITRFKGDLYFKALPGLNDTSKTVFIKDFELESSTNNFLVNNGLTYLVDHVFYEDIKEQMNYSYESDYQQVIELINAEIREIKYNNLILRGELQDIKIHGFYIDNNNLEIYMNARGRFDAEVVLE